MLFNVKDNVVQEIKEQPFKSEKELQTLCENNLQKLINLEFVDTEFLWLILDLILLLLMKKLIRLLLLSIKIREM